MEVMAMAIRDHVRKGTFDAALAPEVGGTRERATAIVWGLARITVGWTFLWAFLDKVFGWGYATPAGKGWIDGGSPTAGFLKGSATGPFEGFYKAIAGTNWANWLFMLGLLGIGVALLLGIGMRIAGISGVLLYLMMWTVTLPPPNNPIIDEHVLGALLVAGLVLARAGDTLGLGKLWRQTALVQKLPWLE
jgi:thiosulfate dehydrogenase [quinone] large subunit